MGGKGGGGGAEAAVAYALVARGSWGGEIATLTGLPARTVGCALRRLRDQGLVVRVGTVRICEGHRSTQVALWGQAGARWVGLLHVNRWHPEGDRPRALAPERVAAHRTVAAYRWGWDDGFEW